MRVTRDGVAQLCDFGLVRLIHDQMATGLTTTTAHTGTARYLSLELVEADEVTMPTTASDIWALGCVGMEVNSYVLFTIQSLTLDEVHLPATSIRLYSNQLTQCALQDLSRDWQRSAAGYTTRGCIRGNINVMESLPRMLAP